MGWEKSLLSWQEPFCFVLHAKQVVTTNYLNTAGETNAYAKLKTFAGEIYIKQVPGMFIFVAWAKEQQLTGNVQHTIQHIRVVTRFIGTFRITRWKSRGHFRKMGKSEKKKD